MQTYNFYKCEYVLQSFYPLLFCAWFSSPELSLISFCLSLNLLQVTHVIAQHTYF